jgi:hypothetical protein
MNPAFLIAVCHLPIAIFKDRTFYPVLGRIVSYITLFIRPKEGRN